MRKDRRKNKKRRTFAVVLFFVCILTFFAMSLSITNKNYDLSVGSICPETILATRDVVDEITTEELRDQAAAKVETIYAQDETIAASAQAEVTAFFDAISDARKLLEQEASDAGMSFSAYRAQLTEEQLQSLQEKIPIALERDLLLSAILLDDTMLAEATSVVNLALKSAFESGLKEEDVQAKISELLAEIQEDTSLSRTAKLLCEPVIRETLRANLYMDTEATQQAIEEARAAVVPVEYKKGQAIAREGDVMTEQQIAVLTELGMTNGKLNIWPYVALLCVVVVCTIGYYALGKTIEPRLLKPVKTNGVTAIVFLLSVLVSAVLCKMEMRALSSVLVAICVTEAYDAKSGAAIGALTAAAVGAMGYIAGVDSKICFSYLIANVLSSIACSIAIQKSKSRSGVVVAASLGAIVAAVVYLIFDLADAQPLMVVLQSMGWGFGGALLCGFLSLGTMPIWENFFGVVTPVKLMELCNPSFPLLKRMTIEAPGTYHHSVMVANLAEAAAGAIGADIYVAWAGAYYHDVGKLMAPMYFSENQTGVNPHDRLTPEESCAIIARHPHDGARILEEYHMPQCCIDIALTHHGTSLMLFFANKAKELSGGKININKFRHTGYKPWTKEQAIVMLADGVEAATRSNPSNLDKTIDSIIRGKIEEDQLTDVPLTMNELNSIADAFSEVLHGAYHSRVEYPDVDATDFIPEGKEKA